MIQHDNSTDLYNRFWTAFKKKAEKASHSFNFSYSGDRWIKHSLGYNYEDIFLELRVVKPKSYIAAQIRCSHQFYEKLLSYRGDVEARISKELLWERKEGRKVCTISLFEPFNLRDADKWEWAFSWILEKARLFIDIFEPLLKMPSKPEDLKNINRSDSNRKTHEPTIPTKEDIEVAESKLRNTPDEVIGIDTVLDQVKDNFQKAGKPLQSNWLEITKRNIEIWFRTKG